MTIKGGVGTERRVKEKEKEVEVKEKEERPSEVRGKKQDLANFQSYPGIPQEGIRNTRRSYCSPPKGTDW